MLDDRLSDDGLTFRSLKEGNYHLAKFGPFGHFLGLTSAKPPVLVQIREKSTASILDIEVSCRSDRLPLWFKPLRYGVEDVSFVELRLQIGDVQYLIRKASGA